MRKLLTRLYCAMIMVSISVFASAQNCVSQNYSKQFSLPGHDLDIVNEATAPNGDIFLFGAVSINIPFATGNSAFVIKLNKQGNIVWKRKIDFTTNMGLRHSTSISLKDGSIVISLIGGGTLLLIKIDTDGNLIWEKRMTINQPIFNSGSATSLYGSSTMEAENGDIFTLYNSYGFFTLTHLNANGEIIWDKSFLCDNEDNINAFRRSSYAGVHECGDSLIITGIYINGALYPPDANLFFAMKMDKAAGNAAKPVAYKRTGDYNNHFFWGSFYPASFKINNDGVCLVDGGYDDWLPPDKENMRRQLFDLLYFDNNLTLKKASQLNIPGFDMSPVYSANGKGDICLINRDGTNFVISTFNVDKNNIVQQREFQTQRYMDAGSRQPYAVITADGAISITSQVTNNEKNEGIGVIQYNTSDFIRYPSCFGMEITCGSKIDYTPARADFSWTKIMTNILVEEAPNTSFGDIDIKTEDICSTTGICNNIKIIGPDTICNYGQEVKYVARLNGECYKKVSWKAIDPYAPDFIPTVKMVNNTTCSIEYPQNEIQYRYIKLYAYVENCNTLIDSTSIVFSPTPTKDTAENKFCYGLQAQLFPGWDYSDYLWSNGDTTKIIEISTPGIYKVNFTYCGTKKGTKIFDISFTADHFFDDKQMIKCNNDSLLIILDKSYTYNWLSNYNIQQLSNNSAKLFPLKDTVYVVRARTSDECFLNDSLQIKVINTPPIFLGNDTSICQNTSLVLQAPDGFERYEWNDGFNGTQRTVSKKGTYSLTAIDNNGCHSQDTFTLKEVFPLPAIQLSKTDILCKDQSTKLDAGDYKTFQWQDGSSSRYFEVNKPGKYFVTATDNNNCSNRDTILIKAIVDTPANFIFTDTAICKYGGVLLKPVAENLQSFLWSNGTIQNSLFIEVPGTYTLLVTDKNGCTGTERINVIAKDCINKLIFPNAFSPDNDGNNDVFRPFVAGKLLYYKISIYNRWGQKIFCSTDYNNGWRGEKLYGSYIWLCEYQFAGEKKMLQKGYVIEVR